VSDEIDCAWYLIVERMKKLGTLEKLFEIQPPKDWSTATHGGPRKITIQHIVDMETHTDDKTVGEGDK